MFAKLTNVLGDRAKLTLDLEEQVEEIVMDSAKTHAIFEAAKSSMGNYSERFIKLCWGI